MHITEGMGLLFSTFTGANLAKEFFRILILFILCTFEALHVYYLKCVAQTERIKKKKKKELLSHTRTVEVGPSLSSPPLAPCALWFYASIKY